MEEGLVQFLIIVAFVVISLIEGVTRKKKGGPPTEPSEAATHARERGLPSPDDDDGPAVSEELWDDIARLARGQQRQDGGLIVEDSDPISGTRMPVVVPRERFPTRLAGASFDDEVEEDIPELEAVPVEPKTAREICRQPLVERVEVLEPPPTRPTGNETPRRSARKADDSTAAWFRAQGASSVGLRQAIVLREVLGPPVAMRGDRDPAD